jgi:glutamine amidotransferase
MMQVALVDYGSGNLRSAHKALEHAASGRGLSIKVKVTADPAVVTAADRIVLPGVGAFKDCADGLARVDGLRPAIEDAVMGRGTPFLGICVGMQLMATHGLEFEETEGLGWIPGLVRRIAPRDPSAKIPHMGWNALDVLRPHRVFEGERYGEDGAHAYFVHSYEFVPADGEAIVATTDYGGPIVAAVARGNLVGTQFHPEKSQSLGLNVLANFLAWRP